MYNSMAVWFFNSFYRGGKFYIYRGLKREDFSYEVTAIIGLIVLDLCLSWRKKLRMLQKDLSTQHIAKLIANCDFSLDLLSDFVMTVNIISIASKVP